MKNPLILAALLLMPVAVSAQDMTPLSEMPAGKYILDKSHASLTWEISHLGLSDYTARFNDFDAVLTLDPVNPENSSIEATISPFAIKTDYPSPEKKDFDKILATDAAWFDGGNFPKITFKSTNIEITGDNVGIVNGNLTMLGVSKPVALEVEFNGAFAEKPFANVPALGFSVNTEINRSEWGMDTYVPNIGDEVEIDIEAEFHLEADETPEATSAAE